MVSINIALLGLALVASPTFVAAQDMSKIQLDVLRDINTLAKPLGKPFNVQATGLPQSYQLVHAPWPGSEWLAAKDGINRRWKYEETSPAEKYARAYGLDVNAFRDAMSAANGVLHYDQRKMCATINGCDDLKDDSRCALREDQEVGRCVPRSIGMSYAWAPAAVMESEPRCPVTVNDVTFQVSDIKGLLTQVYAAAHLKVAYVGTNAAYEDPVARHTKESASGRDLNAAVFHIAVTNLMGKLHRSFVMDMDLSGGVTHSPIYSYEILKQKKMSPTHAAFKYFKSLKYPFSKQAKNVLAVKNKISWILPGDANMPYVWTGMVESRTSDRVLEYFLELDDKTNIIGGEWVRDSAVRRPHSLWFPTERPAQDFVDGASGLSYRHVQALVQASANTTCH